MLVTVAFYLSSFFTMNIAICACLGYFLIADVFLFLLLVLYVTSLENVVKSMSLFSFVKVVSAHAAVVQLCVLSCSFF